VSLVRDQAARDRVRDAHDVSLFVEAGAGTGKTSALVDRVAALVTAGRVELRHLAAITFTEAAAAELRDRVRAELEKVAIDPGRDAAARRRSEVALDQLDDAALTTLHGFAHRLLTEHPFDVGLPPGFRVLEEIEASVEFEQRWAALVDELFADPDLERALTTWLAGGLSVGALRPIAAELCTYHDRLAPPSPPAPIPAPRAAELLAALEGLAALRRDRCLDDADRLAEHLDELAPYREALAAARDELDVLEAVYTVPELKCSRGRTECWDHVEVVRDACRDAERLRVAVLDEPRQAALSVLAGRLSDFARRFADDRRREGRLWFHDLLVLARDLLRDHPDARAAAAARYQRLLIDEFQDTDPLQIELAVLLASADADPGSRPWSAATIRPGALTLVGDPKQAIYRFRDADLRVYHEARAELGLEPVELVENFRSAAPILDTVNRVFEALLEEVAGVQAAHVPLLAHREPPGPTRVAVLGGAEDAPVVAVRESEADDVAATVRLIVDEGWPVEDRGGVRPAVERDIALLIPSRTVLPALEAALERAGVPVRVESQSLVYSTAEVRDLLQVLAAIDDPTDQIAVVAALRSSGFGCSDADLVLHADAGGGWDYRRDPPGDPAEDPVGAGLLGLRGFWEQRWWRPVSGTVEAVVRERRLLELASRHRRPRDHWRRLRFLLDEARAWDDTGETSLRGFVDWARRQADQGARANESVAAEPDDPALRILTVHGAKGLEFPIVILAGLNTAKPNQPPPVLWGAGGPALRAGTVRRGLVETGEYADRRALEAARDDAERLRLLYVAMTRARDHLVVSLHHKGQTSSCHAARLAPRLAALPVLRPRPAPVDEPPALDPVPASADPTVREAWIEQRAATLARAGAPASVAATTLAEQEADEAFPDDAVDTRPPWQRGRAGTALGRAVHAVLQTVDLETGAGLEATARAQALAEGVAGREREVRALVESVLASPTVRAIADGGWPRWREVPVAADVDGVLLEGFVDLLARTPDGLLVVDYKTDVVPTDADLDAAVARYAVQGAAYALALEATLREPVAGCVFVFARARGAVERAVEDLPAAVSAVRERLARAPT
jgi:ATP-dependent exoDNAse (exonuclease V) beta subunit